MKKTASHSLSHLIFSNSFDYSTDHVMDWLLHFSQTISRVNSSDKQLDWEDITLSNQAIPNTTQEENYASVWYRKTAGVERIDRLHQNNLNEATLYTSLPYFNQTIEQELRNVYDHFYRKVFCTKQLSRYLSLPLNKLYVLERARKLGLQIPDTLLTRKRGKLLEFFEKNKAGIINKSIADHVMCYDQSPVKRSYSNYTEELTKEFIIELPEVFGMSLFQEKLDKAYEIRSFYLDEKCYSMAIFSQGNNQTSLDFRRYDDARPNRRTAYQLPKSIEQQIGLLMKDLDLNTGSIDLVKPKMIDLFF